MKYLDLDGLQRYDQKIKEVIEEKSIGVVKEEAFEGRFLSIPNTGASRINKYDLLGITEQVQTVQSKNLFNIDLAVGNALSRLENSFKLQKLTAGGDQPGRMSKVVNISLPANTPITFSANTVSTTTVGTKLGIYTEHEDLTASDFSIVALSVTKTFTSPVKTLRLFLVAEEAVGAYTEFNNFQIELGSAATSYRPFAPSSPSLEYPSPLVYSKGEVTIAQSALNLWDADSVFNKLRADMPTVFEPAVYENKRCMRCGVGNNAQARTYKFHEGLFKNKTCYTFRVMFHNATANHGLCFVVYYTDGTYMYLRNSGAAGWNSITAYSDQFKTVSYVGFLFVTANTTVLYDLDAFQVTEGLEQLPYTPYTGKVDVITLKDSNGILRSLRSLPNGIRDSFDPLTRKGITRVGSYKITTATTGYGLITALANCSVVRLVLQDTPIMSGDTANAWSTHFKAELGRDEIGYFGLGSAGLNAALYLRLPPSVTTSALAKTYMDSVVNSTGDIEFLHVLMTPIEWELDANEQVPVLNTYESITNIASNAVVRARDYAQPEVGTISILKDRDGKTINPMTKTDAVIFNDLENLTEKWEQVDNNTEQIANIQEAFLGAVSEEKFGASELLSIPNTEAGTLNSFKILGNAKQEVTVQGKNLSNAPNVTETFTSDSRYKMAYLGVALPIGTTVTVSWDYNFTVAPSTPPTAKVQLAYAAVTNSFQQSFDTTYPNTTSGRVAITFTIPTFYSQDIFLHRETNAGTAVPCTVNISNVMVALGNDSTYEPFTPNSPSPPYPSAIRTAGTSTNITACGENLFNHRNNNISNGTAVVVDDFVRVTGNDNPETVDYANTRGWYRPNYNITSGYNQPYLKQNDVVTVSADARLIENSRGSGIRVYLVSNVNGGGQTPATVLNLELNVWKRISLQFIITNMSLIGQNDYYPIFPVNSNIVDIKNITIKLGADSTYTPYIGSTTPITFRDTNGNLHDMGSLPDGTADEVDVYSGAGLDIQKTLTVTSGTSPYSFNFVNISDTVANLVFNDTANPFGYVKTLLPRRCNIAEPTYYGVAGGFGCDARVNDTQVALFVLKSKITNAGFTLDNAGAQSYINKIIADMGKPIVFQYPLATPVNWTLHPDERKKIPTYNGHTNIFTDTRALLEAKEIQATTIGRPTVLKNAANETLNPLTTTDLVWDKKLNKNQAEINEGKLDKVESTAPYERAYTVNEVGANIMRNATSANLPWSIAIRDVNACLVAADGISPLHVVNKRQLDTKLDKVTNTATYGRTYGVGTAGNQAMYNVAYSNAGDSLVLRDTYGRTHVSDAQENTHAVNKKQMQDYVQANAGGWTVVHSNRENILVTAPSYYEVVNKEINITIPIDKRMDIEIDWEAYYHAPAEGHVQASRHRQYACFYAHDYTSASISLNYKTKAFLDGPYGKDYISDLEVQYGTSSLYIRLQDESATPVAVIIRGIRYKVVDINA